LWDPAKKRGLLEPWRDGIKGFQKWRGWSPEFPMVIPTDPNFGGSTTRKTYISTTFTLQDIAQLRRFMVNELEDLRGLIKSNQII